jgi:hypothetical protein
MTVIAIEESIWDNLLVTILILAKSPLYTYLVGTSTSANTPNLKAMDLKSASPHACRGTPKHLSQVVR